MSGVIFVLRRSGWLVACVALFAAGVAFVLSGMQDEVYEATASVRPAARSALPDVQTGLQAPATIARAAELAEGVAGVDDIDDAIEVSADRGDGLVFVRAEGPTGAAAAALANAVVLAYEEEARRAAITAIQAQLAELEPALAQARQRLQGVDAAIEERLEELRGDDEEEIAQDDALASLRAERDAAARARDEAVARVDEAEAALGSPSTGFGVEAPATAPGDPERPRTVRNVAAGAALGLVLGGLLALRRTRRLAPDDPAGVQATIGAPLIATLPPRRGNRPLDLSPASPLAYVGGVAIAALFHRDPNLDGRLVLISSAKRREGRTLLATVLAVTAARRGRSVLLIDGDPERRGLSSMCALDDAPGLTDLAAGVVGLGDVVHRFPMADVGPLGIVPAGRSAADPAGVLGATTDAIAGLVERAELVIVDAPPLLSSASAVELASRADWVVLALGPELSRADLHQANQRLRLLQSRLLGVVTNPFLPGAKGGPPEFEQVGAADSIPVAALPPAPRVVAPPAAGAPSGDDAGFAISLPNARGSAFTEPVAPVVVPPRRPPLDEMESLDDVGDEFDAYDDDEYHDDEYHDDVRGPELHDDDETVDAELVEDDDDHDEHDEPEDHEHAEEVVEAPPAVPVAPAADALTPLGFTLPERRDD